MLTYNYENRTPDLQKYYRLLNLFLLLMHTVLLVAFVLVKAYVMAYLNVFSVIFYSLSFITIKRNKYYIYVTTSYLEIWLHVTMAVISIGWDAGFEIYCFLLVPLVFLSLYIGVTSQYNTIPAWIASIIDILTYFILRLYTYGHEAIYADILTSQAIACFYYFNLAIVFCGMVVTMRFFAMYALRSERELHNMAEFDELTGLYNRRYIRGVLDEVYKEYVEEDKSFSVAITDLDDFKLINDTFGHDAGDLVLKIVASYFKELAPYNACVARWGGEEFIIVFRENSSYELCCEYMENIRTKIFSSPVEYDDNSITITLTCGVASFDEGMTITDIIRKADSRLYDGKSMGKNIVVCS